MSRRSIVITGATGALGSLAAKTFAAMGHNLTLLDIDKNKLDSLVRDLNLPSERLYAEVVNLLNEQALQDSARAVLSKFGNVHALFHLVGGWSGGKTLAETSADDLEAMLNQHVRTTFNLFKAFEDALSQSGWGRVITISPSTVANPPAKRGVYLAAKSAQETMMLALAAELKDFNVTANIIQVKAIDVENKGNGTTPDEIVAAMQYLFSENADKVNAARVPLY
ncbi:MAG TPA: SDR family oxidoreductase [Anaerolineales bacterium]|nr:SDR family oxidoreductase [Anaerolineales bacterium]HNA87718.1 SDR family oxidoreductase [Anaerolineales bacterium]HNB34604.1 SDR family oxidoreductase [Anaerolineales bacterium]HNC07406.1 SDR family oxidoreductase [Anaerolineales bacterium]